MRALLAVALTVALHAAGDEGPFSRATLLAHRGVSQGFTREGIDASTCTASRMLQPKHDFLENTLPSIAAAFESGANVVEIDVHPTSDGEFVVFHDWRLECRTDGHGVTRERPLAYLKSLDVGHGYTADGGATFPFRGRFVGAMPTWREVVEAFPKRRFLVNIKSNDAAEGFAAVAYAKPLEISPESIAFSGGEQPMAAIRREWPGVRTLSRPRLKSCLLGYLALGWSGHVPEACRDAIVYVPINYAHLLWGWPQRFVERMRSANSEVFAIGPYTSRTDREGTTGLDSLEELAALPTDFSGGIVTDRIEVIGKALRPP